MAAERRSWAVMSARFLGRSLTVRASAHLFALLAITVGAAIAATMLTLRSDLGAKMTRELRRYGPNLILVPAAGQEPALLDEAAVRGVAALDPGFQPAPALVTTALLRRVDNANPAGGGAQSVGARRAAACGVIGADLERTAAQNPEWEIEGGWPHGEALLVGRGLAQRAGVATGDIVALELGGTTLRLTVAGILATGESEDDEALVPLVVLQRATGLDGRVSLATFAIDGGLPAVERAAARLAAAVPASAARPLRPIAAAQGAILSRLERLMLALTLVVLALSGLCLATTLMGMVLEREPEIALFRALGAGDGDVTRMVLGEVTLLGILGAGLGVAIGALLARLVGARLFGAAIEPRLAVLPWVTAIALLLAWGSALLPLRRALAIRPAAALRGE